MKLAFHLNHLDLRGTGVALYCYAHYAEEILGHQSIIVAPSFESRPEYQDQQAIKKFENRFKVFTYEDFSEVDDLMRDQQIDVLYMMKAGNNDGLVSTVCKTVIHAVFQWAEPHGDVYAYISDWLSQKMSGGRYAAVPYIVEKLPPAHGAREDLDIPADALVFGRHGGPETFDLPFVHDAVIEVAKQRPDIYFLFLNTKPFCPPRENIIHLEGTANLTDKASFIQSCDAMLHARRQGESFGLAIAEFAVSNKPVITFNGGVDQAHLDMLGPTGFYYRDFNSLVKLLVNFEYDRQANWDCYTERFGPVPVMERFAKVFLS